MRRADQENCSIHLRNNLSRGLDEKSTRIFGPDAPPARDRPNSVTYNSIETVQLQGPTPFPDLEIRQNPDIDLLIAYKLPP